MNQKANVVKSNESQLMIHSITFYMILLFFYKLFKQIIMRLSAYAKQNGITYETAYKYWKQGITKGKRLSTGTIFIENTESEKCVKTVITNTVILYARVSSSENKQNLETQLQRLKDFASVKKYTVIGEVKEICSSINANRRKLLSLLDHNDYK